MLEEGHVSPPDIIDVNERGSTVLGRGSAVLDLEFAPLNVPISYHSKLLTKSTGASNTARCVVDDLEYALSSSPPYGKETATHQFDSEVLSTTTSAAAPLPSPPTRGRVVACVDRSNNRNRGSVTATSYIRERQNATYSSDAEVPSIEKWATARGSVVVDVEFAPASESLMRVPTGRNADLDYESDQTDLDWDGEHDDFSSAPSEISRESNHNSYSSCNPRIDSDNKEELIEIEPLSQSFLRKGWKKEANVCSQGRSLWLSPCENIRFKNKKTAIRFDSICVDCDGDEKEAFETLSNELKGAGQFVAHHVLMGGIDFLQTPKRGTLQGQIKPSETETRIPTNNNSGEVLDCEEENQVRLNCT